MPHSVFIETTIPSYYVARPSRDPLQRSRQQMTKDWWDNERFNFDLFTSQLVIEEAAAGETAKAAERVKLLDGIPHLQLNDKVEALTEKLLTTQILPPHAGRDASHIAAAGVHGMDFLLTWNCRHIANPFIADRLRACFSKMGVHLPVICTPEQFLAL